MRTQDEIVARMRVKEEGDLFGFAREVLACYLDFEHAREFLRPEMTREEWEKDLPAATDARALGEMRDYAEFAWGKAKDHRGISASRSIDKLSAWAWLLGRDDVLEKVGKTPYAQYGCPQLQVFCEAFGFPMPDDEAAQRMMRGLPCYDGCESGCGQE
jgi:hypothetical protein